MRESFQIVHTSISKAVQNFLVIHKTVLNLYPYLPSLKTANIYVKNMSFKHTCNDDVVSDVENSKN